MCLTYLSKNESELNQTSSIHFICGVCGASTATLTSYPFDVVRTRLVAQKSNHVGYHIICLGHRLNETR